MTTQTRITLKNVKYMASLSEETYCYSATVYFDGKKVGTTSNRGHGGCDDEYATDKDGWSAMKDYVDTLPPVVTDMKDPHDDTKMFSYEQSAEGVFHELVTDFLMARDLKRELGKKVLFQKVGSDAVFETKRAPNKEVLKSWIQQVSSRADTAAVLNQIPFNSALQIYGRI